MSDLTGRTLGPYQLIDEIGHGGMANVYRALQPSIGRQVAIKVLPTNFLQDRTFLERFNREVKVIAQLQHPRILPVYDYGEQDDLPYIVMAYMSGGTLADHIRRQGGLLLDEAVRLVDQIAEGLDFAHEKGIVHRDFKPSNVLLDEKGNVYLADFGIAKVTEATAQLTGSGIVGTPAYMAPEMARRGGVSPLVDVYALGVTVFEMLSGQHPYQADTPMGILLAHGTEPIPDVRELRPDLPESVQEVIERAMEKDPGRRTQSAGALSTGFAQAASGATVPQHQLPAAPAIEPAYPEQAAVLPTPPDVPTMDVIQAQRLPHQAALSATEQMSPEAQAAVPRSASGASIQAWVWLVGGMTGVILLILGVVATGVLRSFVPIANTAEKTVSPTLTYIPTEIPIEATIEPLAAIRNCGDEASPDVLPDLGGREVTMALENAYPPFNSMDPSTGGGIGWDYDAGREICARLNCVPVFTVVAWDTILNEMAAHSYDALFDGVTYTPERDEKVDFSCSYVTVEQVLLALASENRFSTAEEFQDNSSLVVATLEFTTSEEAATEFVGVDRVRLGQDIGALTQWLLAGDVDAVVMDMVIARSISGQHPGQLKAIWGVAHSDEQLALVFPPGSDLLAPVNSALDAMAADGTLGNLNGKWLSP